MDPLTCITVAALLVMATVGAVALFRYTCAPTSAR